MHNLLNKYVYIDNIMFNTTLLFNTVYNNDSLGMEFPFHTNRYNLFYFILTQCFV